MNRDEAEEIAEARKEIQNLMIDKNLPSLHDEIISAVEQGRPLRESLVRRWAREAGFVVRKAPREHGELGPLLPPNAATRFTVILSEHIADRSRTKFLDGVTLEELACYITGYMREGCY